MRIENLREGMKVKISDNISITEDHFSSCPDMLRMVGTVRKISDIASDRVYIGGYMWHPDDLQPSIEAKEKRSFIFNASELVIDGVD